MNLGRPGVRFESPYNYLAYPRRYDSRARRKIVEEKTTRRDWRDKGEYSLALAPVSPRFSACFPFALVEGLDWGHKCQLSVRILAICQLSVKSV